MAKDSEKIEEILETVKSMQSQINFLSVQMGTGVKAPSSDRSESGRGSGTAAIDAKQLQVLDKKFDDLSDQLSKNGENLNTISEQVSALTSTKVEQADERMNQVTRLLEKGLELTEMGSQLTEIKDRLEEVLVELATAAKSAEVLKGISEEETN
jgi:ABC-type transporter Mla subunit MlaD